MRAFLSRWAGAGLLPLVVCVVALLGLSGVPLLAGEPPVPIEGKLLVTVVGPDYFMEGSSDNIIPAPAGGDMSPRMDQIVYDTAWDGYELWKVDIDGSNPVNLSALAGLSGASCIPRWSPDGSKIAFQHFYPVEGLLACEAGMSAWVMNADGTDAHQVTPDSMIHVEVGSWSPNGYRLLCHMWDSAAWDPEGPPGQVVESWAFTIDIDGTDLEVVPNLDAVDADWSPDGSKIITSWSEPDVVDGEPGVWRQLRVTDADGSNPQTLVEHFLPYSVAEALDMPSRYWVGPVKVTWSPRGDRIAFLAMLPVDPDWSPWPEQVELWIYDLVADDLTKLTDNLDHESWLSWNGDNTFPEDPEVTVDNTTVTFEGVSEDGLTTILRDDDPPELPTGYEFCEEFYEVTTTAQISGPISICMTYDDADIPTGSSEADLCLLHYVEDGDYWEDITVSRDPDNNVVCGETTSLSVFTLSGAPSTRFPDVPSHGSGDSGIDPHWAFYEVDACARNGVVGGYGDGSYQPTWQVTRGQMAAFIARALVAPEGDEGLESWTAPVTPSFPDVGTGFWAYKHVEYLKSLKIAGGYDDGLYRPTATVTRSQMAAYMSRAIADPKGDEGLAGFTPPATPTFPDVPEDQWAYTYIEYAVANGVVQGYPYPDPEDPDATIYRYLPGNIVTRCQMAVYVARAFDLMP